MSAGTERLKPAFVGSLALHGALVGALAGWQFFSQYAKEQWGSPDSIASGSVSITPYQTIPIPQRPGPVNPVANDTESQLPAQPKEERKPQEKRKEDPKAVALNLERERRRQTDIAARNQKYRADDQNRTNQVYSTTSPRAVSPMFGVQGAGGVGTGTGSVLGTRFGWYEALLRQKVAERWKTSDLDPRIRTLPVAIVTFTIQRDGSIRAVRLAQSSGNYVLDTSAQRAIYEASPFPPLPPQFERDSAAIEFWFELKR